MADHYCKEHGIVFFKKGGMKGYAHPVGDEGKWCNEPEGGGSPIPEDKLNTNEATAQEKGYALIRATELAVAGIIKPNAILSYAEVFYRYTKGDIEVKDEQVFKGLIGKYFIDKTEEQDSSQ